MVTPMTRVLCLLQLQQNIKDERFERRGNPLNLLGYKADL